MLGFRDIYPWFQSIFSLVYKLRLVRFQSLIFPGAEVLQQGFRPRRYRVSCSDVIPSEREVALSGRGVLVLVIIVGTGL